MNILYLCDEYPPGRHGGIGSAVRLLARTVAAEGHNVYVAGMYDLGYGGEDEFDDEGVKVFRFRRVLTSSFFSKPDSLVVRGTYRVLKQLSVLHWDAKTSLKKYEQFLEQLIKKYNIDLVEMPDYNDYMRFCKSSVYFPKLPVKTIVKLHGSITFLNEELGQPTPAFVREMEKAVLDNADAVVSVSAYTAKKSALYFGYTKDIRVLYNGIKMPEEKKVQKDKNLVVYTGSLLHLKGVYQLMEAWNIVSEKMPEARLCMLGKGSTEKARALLSPGAEDTVMFGGHVSRPELEDTIAKASVTVFPSYVETFGLGPVEAMASGTAVIFTQRASGPEIIAQNETGLLIDPDNVQEIADAIISILSDKQLREKFETAGKVSAKQRFSIEKVATDHIAFYKSIIG